jgi:Leishmanolysin
MVAYAHLTGGERRVGVPVENVGGSGSRDSHWRESMLGTELMTSRVGEPGNAQSRLTVAAVSDIRYEIDFEAGEHSRCRPPRWLCVPCPS